MDIKSRYDVKDSLSLYHKTLFLLRKDKRSTKEIANSSGLPQFWLRNFRQGMIINPSVNKVQFLYEYLTGKELHLND